MSVTEGDNLAELHISGCESSKCTFNPNRVEKIVLWIVSGSSQLKYIRKPHTYELNFKLFCKAAIDVT